MQTTKGGLPKLMNIQMELRKCCNHPYLINGVEEKEMEQLEYDFFTFGDRDVKKFCQCGKQTRGQSEVEI